MQETIQQISDLIRQIETDYPELYQYLDENPMTLPQSSDPKVDEQAMVDYLRSLELLLENHKRLHKT